MSACSICWGMKPSRKEERSSAVREAGVSGVVAGAAGVGLAATGRLALGVGLTSGPWAKSGAAVSQKLAANASVRLEKDASCGCIIRFLLTRINDTDEATAGSRLLECSRGRLTLQKPERSWL